MICGLTVVTFVGRSEFHSIKHAVIPILGLLGNIGLLVGVVVIGLTTPGVSADATKLAIWITLGWGAVSIAYLVWNSKKQEKAIFPSVARQ
jgi:hypothetical protein